MLKFLIILQIFYWLCKRSNVNPASALTLSGIVSGGASLTKTNAGMLNLTAANTYFSVTSFHEITDQILIGAQFCVSSQNGFSISLGYDGKFGNGSKINQLNIAMDWKF